MKSRRKRPHLGSLRGEGRNKTRQKKGSKLLRRKKGDPLMEGEALKKKKKGGGGRKITCITFP